MSRTISYFLVLDEKFMNETLKNPFDLKDGDIVNLVHIFERHTYFHQLSAFSYPSEEQEKSIKESVLNILDGYKQKILAESSKSLKINCQCLFSRTPKETSVEFLEESKSDIAVVATRERSGLLGLFSSSFTDYLCRHTKADIYVTRHFETNEQG